MNETIMIVEPFPTDIFEATTYLVGMGFYLFPVGLTTSTTIEGLVKLEKKPLCLWRKDSTNEAAVIHDMLRNRSAISGLGLGIDCGKSGVYVLDVDVRNGAVGMDSLAALEAKYGTLPQTLVSQTPSGGLHYIFRGHGRNSASSSLLGANLDTRGDGGFIVCPPSVADTGEFYSWRFAPDMVEMADAPAWLLDLTAQSAPATSTTTPTAVIHTEDDEEDFVIGKGSRNDTLYRHACKLRAFGLERNELLGALLFYNEGHCQPPLGQGEVQTLVNQAMKYAPNEELIRKKTVENTIDTLSDQFLNGQGPTADTNTLPELSPEEHEDLVVQVMCEIDERCEGIDVEDQGAVSQVRFGVLNTFKNQLGREELLTLLDDKVPLPGLPSAWGYGGLSQNAQRIITQLEAWNAQKRSFLQDTEILTYLKFQCTYNPIDRFFVGEHLHKMTKVKPALFWSVVDTTEVQAGDFDYTRIYTLKELVALPNMQPQFIIDGISARKSVDLISGLPKVGKSSLVRYTLDCVSSGKDWLGQTVQHPIHVGYLCLEDSPELYTNAMKTMMVDMESAASQDQQDRIHVVFSVKPERLIPMIEEMVARGCEMILIDTFIRAIGACDNSHYGEMVFKTEPLILVAKQHNINVTILHHHAKTAQGSNAITSAHGSVAITGSVSHSMSLSQEHEDGPTTIHSRNRYKGSGNGGFEFKGEILHYESATGSLWLSPPPPPQSQVKLHKSLQLPEIITQLLIDKYQETLGEEGMSKVALYEQVRARLKDDPEFKTGISDKAIKEAIVKLEADAIVQDHPTHKPGGYPAKAIQQEWWDKWGMLKERLEELYPKN